MFKRDDYLLNYPIWKSIRDAIAGQAAIKEAKEDQHAAAEIVPEASGD